MSILICFLILYPVTFKIKVPNAKKVLIAGDFTDWDKGAIEMKKVNDVWQITVDLEPGRYEYKFIVDGNWINDPENPIKVGEFGNSLIEVTEKGDVVIPKSLSNTDWNPSVKFSGDVRFYLNIEDSLKKFTPTGDSKIDLKGYLSSNSALWIRLRYNNENLQSDGAIPVFLERAEFSLREKNIIFRGFYNKFVLSSFEPFDLTGKIGEFHKDFGRDEEGFILNYRLSFLRFIFMYSNGWKEGRDFIFGRAKFFKFISFNFLNEKGFDRIYGSYSPDSFKVDDELVYFNSYKLRRFYSFDIYKDFKNFSLKFAFGMGKLFWRADESSTGEKLEKELKISDYKRFYGSLFYNSGFKLGFSYEYDVHDLKRYFGSYKQGISILTLFFKKGNLRINIKNYHFHLSPENDFSNLFYFHRLSQLEYFETFSLGFKTLLSCIVEFKMPFLPFYVNSRISGPGLGYYPFVYESILKFQKRFLRNYEILADFRYVYFDVPHLRLKNSFFAPYLEIRRNILRYSFVFISYGLDPFTLDEDEWARRLFLEKKGADISLIKDSYLRYGRASETAEKELSKLLLIRIGVEIKF